MISMGYFKLGCFKREIYGMFFSMPMGVSIKDISSWDVSSVTGMIGMFDDSQLSDDNKFQCAIHSSFSDSNGYWL